MLCFILIICLFYLHNEISLVRIIVCISKSFNHVIVFVNPSSTSVWNLLPNNHHNYLPSLYSTVLEMFLHGFLSLVSTLMIAYTTLHIYNPVLLVNIKEFRLATNMNFFMLFLIKFLTYLFIYNLFILYLLRVIIYVILSYINMTTYRIHSLIFSYFANSQDHVFFFMNMIYTVKLNISTSFNKNGYIRS